MHDMKPTLFPAAITTNPINGELDRLSSSGSIARTYEVHNYNSRLYMAVGNGTNYVLVDDVSNYVPSDLVKELADAESEDLVLYRSHHHGHGRIIRRIFSIP